MHKFQLIVFDLDKTLYPNDNGLVDKLCERMDSFISKNFKDINNPKEYRKELFHKYGTTLRGLMIEKDIKPDDFFEFVHNFNIESFLVKDKEVIDMFYNIKQEKILFTNSPRDYALRVLNALGIEKFFSDIVDIHSLGFIPKPSEEAFKRLFKGRIKPEESMIIDDYEHNLKPAKKFGMTTVLVGNGDGNKFPYVDYYINKITDIKKIL